MKHTVKERFLKYVCFDTQADPTSQSFPSSLKQLELSKYICDELDDMGVSYKTNEAGYIYIYLPSNASKSSKKVFFCAHLDTAPDCSGTNVKPIVHVNYQGNDIVLPDDTTEVLTLAKHINLASKIGEDIITASGTTLLGADDKAGVAIIIDTIYQLKNGVDFEHGPVRALLTTDEEIGKGVANLDPSLLDADFGYTLDGGKLGSYEDENFSANSATLKIKGVSAHPGDGAKMENAIKIAGEIIASLPKNELCPEKTTAKQGFIHPTKVEGHLEEATINFIIRDFDTQKLNQHLGVIEEIAKGVMKGYPNSTFELSSKEQYRNMYDVVKNHAYITETAKKAMANLGIEVHHTQIRGGTDGAQLSYLGLPCPNLFAGQHAIHGKQEWVSVQDMEKGVKTCLEIVKLTAEIPT